MRDFEEMFLEPNEEFRRFGPFIKLFVFFFAVFSLENIVFGDKEEVVFHCFPLLQCP